MSEFWNDNCILKVIAGSHSYGMATESSDIDYRGICIPPATYLLGLDHFEQHERKEPDTVIYSLKKFVKLALENNPNIIDALFVDEKHIVHIDRYGHELRGIRDSFLSKKVFKTYGGYAVSRLKKLTEKGKNSIGNKSELIEKYGYDCYSEDTEFLTNSGWKLYDDITEDDLLGTINPLNHQLEFQHYYERIKKKYNNELYHVTNRYTDCMMTGNHRMYISDGHRNKKNNFSMEYIRENANWRFESVENLISNKRSHYHILTTPDPICQDYKISDYYLKLIGLYVSEGTLGKFSKKRGKHRCIRITQTLKGDMRVFEIMSELENYFGFKKYTYDKETVWILHDPDIVDSIYNDCNHKSHNKVLPNWIFKLSKRQGDILLDALIAGDGTHVKDYGAIYYTANKKLAGWVQILAMISGRDSIIYAPSISKSNFNGKELTMYQVYIRNEQGSPKTIKLSNNKVEKIKYNNSIVCFSVPNETLISRRNGRIAIQGNTKDAAHLLRLMSMAVEILTDGKVQVYRPDRELLLDVRNGKYSLEEIVEVYTLLDVSLKAACSLSTLPNEPDYKLINEWLVKVQGEVINKELNQN